MDMFNKIKSTVSNLSTVLPGNPVTREYEISEHIASAGPSLLWKVYKGVKKSTKEEGAVFVLEKKLLDKYPKQERENIISIFKKGIANLTRLRHPSILTVQHSLEESRESLAFATEPVFASLANILGFTENMPVPPPKALKDFELFDLEIKYGFLQLTEGLAFLHNDVKMIHGNLNPESILVNHNGAWKIAGFDFCMQSATSFDSQSNQFTFCEINVNLPPPCIPNLDYLPPEKLLGSQSNFGSDMFSVGLLFYSVHNNGKSLLRNSGRSIDVIKQNYNLLKDLSLNELNSLPAESRDHVKMLLNTSSELRPDAFQTSKLSMFEDVGVKTLQYLDSLYQWDNLQKSQFFKGLPPVIAKMPKRVNLHRVVPCLTKEFLTPVMVPFVLPNVLIICEDITKEEFQAHVMKELIPLFKVQEPVQITLIFLQKMDLLLSKCTPEVISNHVLPMIYRSLESDAQQIQELCLSIIPKFASLIEYSAMKNALLPRIKKLCIATSFLSVRVNSLVCVGKLLEHLDKWLVLDDILPFLPQIPSKEPAVLMGILGILKLTMSHKKLGITKEIMANKIIPFLMPLAIENGLTLNQFNSIMSVVKEMVNFVETEHRTKLQQLNSIRQEHNATLDMAQMLPEFSVENDKSGVDDMFKDLGLDTESSPKNTVKAKKNNATKSKPQTDQMVTKFSNMSFEEKKALAWNQEQHRKYIQSQAKQPLVPSRDAASSLIDSNLRGFSSTSKSLETFNSLNLPNANYVPNNWPSNFAQPSHFTTSPGPNYPTSPPMNYSSCQPNYPTSPPMGSSNYPRPYHQSSSNSPGLELDSLRGLGQQKSMGNMKSPPGQNQSMDLRSLDSLLPNMGKQNPTLSQLSGQRGMGNGNMRSGGGDFPAISPPPKYNNPQNSSMSSANKELDDLLG